MIKNIFAGLILSIGLISSALCAQGIPAGGISLLPSAPYGGFYMGDPKPLGTTKTVSVKDMPFKKAVRTVGQHGAKNLWDFQMDVKSVAPVAKGDVLLATFWMRCVRSLEESGTGQTAFVFQHNGDPWTTAVEQSASAGQQWQQFFVPFESVQNLKAGEALMAFRLGYEAQTLEFGGIQVVDYGKTRSLKDLPKTKVVYKGMEDAAPWRVRAAQRIEKYRTAHLKIRVVDVQGNPVEGAQVEILQTRSAFLWGTAVQAKRLGGDEPAAGSDDARYRHALKTWFNAAVMENAFKSPPLAGDWGPDWGWDMAVEGANWVTNNGLALRGHVLVWPSWRNEPKAWKALASKPAELKRTILEHIDDTAGGMAGQIKQWDVVNEPFDNRDITDLLGQDSLVDWFKAAQQADPKAQLFLNDYSILAGGKGDTEHRRFYEKTISRLLKKDAPLQGLGMQGHFDAGLTAPEDLKKILDRYARFKLPIMVTEYDMVQGEEDLAGSYTNDFITMMYSHPAVQGVMLWGFWDGAHWKKNAPLFRQDWTLKPAGKAYKELVLGKWKTHVKRLSDAKGQVSLRGHLGDYAFRANLNGKRARAVAKLDKSGINLTLTLK